MENTALYKLVWPAESCLLWHVCCFVLLSRLLFFRPIDIAWLFWVIIFALIQCLCCCRSSLYGLQLWIEWIVVESPEWMLHLRHLKPGRGFVFSILPPNSSSREQTHTNLSQNEINLFHMIFYIAHVPDYFCNSVHSSVAGHLLCSDPAGPPIPFYPQVLLLMNEHIILLLLTTLWTVRKKNTEHKKNLGLFTHTYIHMNVYYCVGTFYWKQ